MIFVSQLYVYKLYACFPTTFLDVLIKVTLCFQNTVAISIN